MTTMPSYEFTGTVILTAQQLFEIVKAAMVAVQTEVQAVAHNPDDALPELLSANQAAEVLYYKTKASLRQYHRKANGLNPQRRNRELFYDKYEVLKLRNILFGNQRFKTK